MLTVYAAEIYFRSRKCTKLLTEKKILEGIGLRDRIKIEKV